MIALTGIPEIRTERLVLRGPAADDWPVWRDFVATDRSRYIGGPMELNTAWRAFCHVIGMWVGRGFGSFVFAHADAPDAPLGLTGPWYPADWPERELGWTVWVPEAEGRGLAFEAASAARDHAFGTLGWDTAVSYIDPDNARSIALAERLGAVRDTEATPPWDGSLVYRHSARPGVPA